VAASPISIAPAANARPNARRRPLILTARRLAANRRNAARSTGPRTPQGKARVARNAIKHGFFAGPERWSEGQHRDFEEMVAGLRDEFRPRDVIEDGCVVTIAASYVRMAALLRYENIAAAKHHEECARELNERIAAATADMAERLTAQREELRRAGLWRPTIPGPREATAICRYQGRLDRAIRDALSDLCSLKGVRGGSRRTSKGTTGRIKNAKTNCRETSSSGILSRCGEGPRAAIQIESKSEKTNPLRASASSGPEALGRTSEGTIEKIENEKTNPLNSMFMGNRHERRRTKAMARRQRT
jgi:hypothetical protein